MRAKTPATVLTLLATPALSAGIDVTVEIPRIEVAEYHRPYVAVWVEKPDHEVAANLAVWYDTRLKDNEGTTWLKDLRQWWRRTGRELDMPVDGISGATRPVGKQDVQIDDGTAALGKLPAGEYRLVVEASREVGGRELVRIPFQWPPTTAQSLTESGSSELGAITLTLTP